MESVIQSGEELLNRLIKLKEDDDLSRIGKLFRTNSNCYFYDTGTGKVVQMEQIVYELLEKFFAGKNETLIRSEELAEFLEVSAKEHLFQAPKITQLYDRGFYEKLPYQVNQNVQQVILEVTGNCNLRCEYCIYNEGYEENRNFNSENMSKETAFVAIDYLAEHGSEEVALAFYGGEPLLRFSLIKECIEYAQKVLSEKKVTYSFTTNCTLMSKEMAEYFSGIKGISILCSIDVPKYIHDEHRKDVNGKGTFDRAIKGLKNLVIAFQNNKDNVEKQLAINGVFCPPYTEEKVEEIYNFFKNLGWLPENVGIQFEPVRFGSLPVKNKQEKNKVENEFLENPMWSWGKKQYEEKALPEEEDKKSWLFLSEIENALTTIQKRYIYDIPLANYPFNACCIPGARRIYVNTKGEFLLCERIENSPNIGSIKDGINIEAIKKFYVKEYSDKSIDECKKCWAIRLCRVCYAECYNKNGIDVEEKCKVCKMIRKSVEENLKLYHEVLEKNPGKLAKLNELIMA